MSWPTDWGGPIPSSQPILGVDATFQGCFQGDWVYFRELKGEACEVRDWCSIYFSRSPWSICLCRPCDRKASWHCASRRGVFTDSKPTVSVAGKWWADGLAEAWHPRHWTLLRDNGTVCLRCSVRILFNWKHVLSKEARIRVCNGLQCEVRFVSCFLIISVILFRLQSSSLINSIVE